MNMIDKINIRKLELSDLDYLYKWLTDERVLEYYGGRDKKYTKEVLLNKYFNTNDNVDRYIIEYDNIIIGYSQVYKIDEELKLEYEYDKDITGAYAMDQYIGEVEYWNKGIGTLYILKIIEYLKQNNKDIKSILLDPHISNKRAIRCYEKAGFKIIKELKEHELFEGKREDCYLMVYDYKG